MLVASYVNISSPIADELIAAFASEQDRRATDRYRLVRRHEQSLAARVLLRAVLERETGRPGKSWDLTCDANGKPELSLKPGERPIYVSLSHCDGMAACAITDVGPIGIDIEDSESDRPFEDIAAIAFGEDEQRAIEEDGKAAFYKIWTLREAMAKGFGTGFPTLVDGRDYFAATRSSDTWRKILDGQEWIFIHRMLLCTYSMAIAVALPASFDGTASLEFWCPDGHQHRPPLTRLAPFRRFPPR